MQRFENNPVGILKKEIYEAGEKLIDKILEEYGIPGLGEMERPGSYIQTTPRAIQEKKKENNDIVLIPLGSTENHGPHCVGGQDTVQVTRLIEAVRRYTAKQGKEVNLTWPVMYGVHPTHHMGMWGTVPIGQTAFEETIIDVMFGLWHDGYRKQVIVNNHGDFWAVVSAIHKFGERYPELPIFVAFVDWITAVGEFFGTKEDGGEFEEPTVHAGEFETSVALLLAPEMVDMEYAVDTESCAYLPDGHFNKACNQYSNRPMLWFQHRGNVPQESFITPEGTIGSATKASAQKAKRPIAAILRYLTLLCNDILEKFPPGKVPPVEEITLFKKKEIEGFLKDPKDPDYENTYKIWRPKQ